jgi:hypothetical protein
MHSSDDSFRMTIDSHLDDRIFALMREINACIDERQRPTVSRARQVLAANHADARMRRADRQPDAAGPSRNAMASRA